MLHVREKFAYANFYFPKREGNDRASFLKIRTLDESRPLLCVSNPMHASGNPDGVTLITNLAKKRAPHSLTMHSQTRTERAFPPLFHMAMHYTLAPATHVVKQGGIDAAAASGPCEEEACLGGTKE